MISVYFAWRRGRGRPRNGKHGLKLVLLSILGIWVFSLCLICIPIYFAGGKFGFDPLHGRCNLLQCEKESTNGRYCIPQLVEAVGVGVPSLVLIISYALVYINLTQTSENGEADSLKRSVLILTACYFIFILPTSITALLPSSVSNWAFIGTIFSCWYWLIYIVNFFIYIIFWRRVRMGILIFIKDVFNIIGFQGYRTKENVSAKESECWWFPLRIL